MRVGGERHFSAALPRIWPRIQCIETGLAPGTVSTGGEILVPTEIPSPSHPTRHFE
jgi:hypothetical protein